MIRVTRVVRLDLLTEVGVELPRPDLLIVQLFFLFILLLLVVLILIRLGGDVPGLEVAVISRAFLDLLEDLVEIVEPDDANTVDGIAFPAVQILLLK